MCSLAAMAWCARANSVVSGPSARQEAGLATQCHRSSALGIEIARRLAYARRDVRTRPACAPTHEDHEGRPVTMNNDTPQIFGEDAHDYPQDAGSFGEHDGDAFTAFRGWAGWGDRVEPVAPDDDYPQPSFSPYEPGPGQPGYPQGPGYAPDSGYAPEMGYAPAVSYPPDHGYAADPDFAEDAGLVPLMESLPDLHEQVDAPAPRTMPPQDMASPAMNVPLPARVPPVISDGRRTVWDDAFLPPSPAADPEYARETSDSLTAESLLHGKRTAPGSGWRRSVYRATGGLLRFGESAAEMRRRDLINRVRTPVAGGHHRVAVLSLKGGVGKTTTAVGLGATLATLRGDRMIAIDANPDRGTLSDKVRLETAATIRDLLNERDQVSRYADVRAFTSQAPSRLEVLASDRDPGVSVAFGADDYCDAARVLEHFYSICITDCGTGLLHSAMSGVLRLTDQIILVSSPSVDGARSASA